jgi:lysozyme
VNPKQARVDRLIARFTYWRDKRKPSRRRSLMLAYLKPRIRSAKEKLAKSKASQVSDRGVQMVANFEGFSPSVYDDGLGFETIGYGFRFPQEYGKPTITRKEAFALLRVKLDGSYGNAVRKASKVAGWPLSQNQFDALVSFTYNLGPGWVGNESWTIWRAFKARDKKGVADALLLYVNPGSPVEVGLRRRRQAERSLWLRG